MNGKRKMTVAKIRSNNRYLLGKVRFLRRELRRHGKDLVRYDEELLSLRKMVEVLSKENGRLREVLHEVRTAKGLV